MLFSLKHMVEKQKQNTVLKIYFKDETRNITKFKTVFTSKIIKT